MSFTGQITNVSTYRESLDWLYNTQLFGVKLGLENISRLVEALDAFPPKNCKVIHVAGTNGKGSTCAMVESIARAAGFKTGLFTSPHLVRFNERIQIDGQPVSDELITAGLNQIRDLVASWEPHPTFFEITTALALRIFKDSQVNVLVAETGMGGRLDATNIIAPSVSVITQIDLDHTQWLGNTLAQIAAEKAGIIKSGVPTIALTQASEILDVIQDAASQQNARLTVVDQPLPHLSIALAGSHQAWNAALALRAIQAAGLEVDFGAIRKGLSSVSWPGRFQLAANGQIILDGAHNPAASARLSQTWREAFGDAKPTVVIGLLADKDAAGIVRELVPIGREFVTVPVRSQRGVHPEVLANQLRDAGVQFVKAADSLKSALGQCSGPILITGSLFLVGEALALLDETELPEVGNQ